MSRPVRRNRYPEPKSGAKSGEAITVDPKVAKAALELAKDKDVHIEVIDGKTVVIKNGKPGKK